MGFDLTGNRLENDDVVLVAKAILCGTTYSTCSNKEQ